MKNTNSNVSIQLPLQVALAASDIISQKLPFDVEGRMLRMPKTPDDDNCVVMFLAETPECLFQTGLIVGQLLYEYHKYIKEKE